MRHRNDQAYSRSAPRRMCLFEFTRVQTHEVQEALICSEFLEKNTNGDEVHEKDEVLLLKVERDGGGRDAEIFRSFPNDNKDLHTSTSHSASRRRTKVAYIHSIFASLLLEDSIFTPDRDIAITTTCDMFPSISYRAQPLSPAFGSPTARAKCVLSHRIV